MRILALIAALALAAPAAAQTKPPAKAEAKPAAKAPAKPAAAKPAPKIAFDARDPQALVTLLAGMQAKATVKSKTPTSVSLDVVTPGGGFGAQFVDCDASGKACQGVAFSTAFQRTGVTLAHVNMFNRTQIACRAYLTDDNRPNVMYSAMITSRLSADEMKQHIGVWQGCLALFNEFSADPVRFLARS
jgi:hypothetical protein